MTDRSRSDLLLGLTAASESPVGPHISGILCTNSTKGQADISTYVQHILDVSPAAQTAVPHPHAPVNKATVSSRIQLQTGIFPAIADQLRSLEVVGMAWQ